MAGAGDERDGTMTDISLQKTAKTAKKGRGRPFPKGQSGNPGGRPRGSSNRATRAAEMLLDGEATALTRKAVELALAGDQAALRLCLDRTVAPRRERAVELALPPIRGADDVLAAIKVVSGAVGRRRHYPRRGVHAVPDDRNLSAGDRRERFRRPVAAIGGRPGCAPRRYSGPAPQLGGAV
jgi:Family of unknown function (DUF5681)